MRKYRHALIARGPLCEQLGAFIGGAIVHRYYLNVAVVLCAETFHAGVDGYLGVIDGYDDADDGICEWRGHCFCAVCV